ncbi:hypothetical protein FACS1894111_03640 [Clostridia bacterium]|nr:hypothetical protein FACS1894111_03640 [Clostridia bacterium]
MITDIILQYSKFAFYGAQVVAYGAYTAIKHFCKRLPECFVVSSLSGNPGAIDGIPVQTPDTLSSDTLIIIAVTEVLQDEIADTLHKSGFHHTVKLTAHEEHLLMSNYYAGIGKFPLADAKISNDTGFNDVDFTLYEIRNHLDMPLQNAPKLKPWEIPIQAGAELTDIRICEQLDNAGKNISSKNRKYCETSAMYWAWKNAKSSWIGLEHYRRHLLISPDMLQDNIDVILPFPYMCCPNVQAQLNRFVDKELVKALQSALKTLHPNHYDCYMECLSGRYHYAYNLIVAKSQVFADYCEWAFGITDYLERLTIPSIKKARALGYVIEMLTSLYFISNQNNLIIKHAEKAIYT